MKGSGEVSALANDSVTTAKIAASQVTNAKIADDTIAEAKLDIHNAPSGTDKYLKYTSNGMEWATAGSGTPEGTAILSTGESGGTKFLREDGDGSSSWQSVPAGTPTTTRGDIIYRAASADARLAKGSNGQVLTMGADDPAWADAAAGATGGGSDKVFWENGQTVTTDYTITNNTNAGTFGPVTINSGVTVTVGSGENWTIV